uniref:Uncharacterized protein n=1 Tax=Rhizophora mucronata TaxID=61149 RepID=A0A2P2R0D9_RHIMU
MINKCMLVFHELASCITGHLSQSTKLSYCEV